MGYTEQQLGSNDTYIGIDSGAAHNAGELGSRPPIAGFELAAKYNHAADLPNAHFLVADARELPLPDGSIDEVLLANVLSDPMLAPKIPAGSSTEGIPVIENIYGEPNVVSEKGQQYYLEDRLGSVREAILKEAARVLKPGGWLAINSFLTPSYVNHEALVDWLQHHGFDARILTPEDPDWHEATAGYLDTDRPSQHHRMVLAQKRTDLPES